MTEPIHIEPKNRGGRPRSPERNSVPELLVQLNKLLAGDELTVHLRSKLLIQKAKLILWQKGEERRAAREAQRTKQDLRIAELEQEVQRLTVENEALRNSPVQRAMQAINKQLRETA